MKNSDLYNFLKTKNDADDFINNIPDHVALQLQNDNFKHLFKDTLIRYGTEIFSSKRVNAYLNKRTDLLTIPMENNYRRFVSDTYDGNYFIKQIDIIRNFFDNRYEYMMSFFNEHVSL